MQFCIDCQQIELLILSAKRVGLGIAFVLFAFLPESDLIFGAVVS
jgi:hypothetical protein